MYNLSYIKQGEIPIINLANKNPLIIHKKSQVFLLSFLIKLLLFGITMALQ